MDAIDSIVSDSSEKESTKGQESGNSGDEGHVKDVTLEEEVKQLVGNVSSWWTGFSKRSQEQITAARKEIESQGGIVSIARKEAQRFEAQLNEAQKAARERAQGAGADHEGVGNTSEQDVDAGKGKQREERIEGDDGDAVERLEEKARRKTRSDSRSEPMVMGTGEAIFDVNEDVGEERISVDQTMELAKQNAQTALHNVQSFWDRLQADPRLSSLQASMAKTLENVSLPKVAAGTKGAATSDAEGGTKTIPTVAFADVSKQFQASFPHLNWKESQALAKKYYEASENVARDWGKEMNTLMSDLVKIVPPEENAETGKVTAAPANVKSTRKDQLPTATTEEEDFDWDGDMDSQSTSTGLQTTTGPPTTSWEGSLSGSETNLASTLQATPLAASAKKSKNVVAKTEKEKEKEEEEEESDWE